MDYTFIIEELRAASLFDLFRLRAALSQQLEEPDRLSKKQECSYQAASQQEKRHR